LYRKIRIYLDTSVPNALLDESRPERREETISFWKRLSRFEVCVSDLVKHEILATRDAEKKRKLLELIAGFRILSSKRDKINELAESYVDAGVVPQDYLYDALHLAVASFYGVEVFVSWNYRHIVKVATKRMVNSLNAIQGHGFLEIVTPSML